MGLWTASHCHRIDAGHVLRVTHSKRWGLPWLLGTAKGHHGMGVAIYNKLGAQNPWGNALENPKVNALCDLDNFLY